MKIRANKISLRQRLKLKRRKPPSSHSRNLDPFNHTKEELVRIFARRGIHMSYAELIEKGHIRES